MDKDIDNVVLDDILEERYELNARFLQKRRRGKIGKKKSDRADRQQRFAEDEEQEKLLVGTPELPSDWRKDTWSIVLLLLLYTLQGIPMGLSGSVPFLLQEKVTYKEQAMFSLVTWPFSLKLLWAPIVDAVYSRNFGRRKSWLVPVQFLCAGIMIYVGGFIEELMGNESSKDDADEPGPPNVKTLTIIFFVLYFLMATQDIAVDGWALTMLSKENVGYASTCNSVGQTLGYFVSYVGFLAFNDAKIANRLFRSEPSNEPLVTLSGFMVFWGWVFFFTTVVVWFVKKELPDGEESDLSLKETYLMLGQVLKLQSVQRLCMVMLTYQIGFAAADSITSLKLVEYGLPKEELALMAPLLIPIGIVLPVLVGKHVSGKYPLDLFMKGYLPRLAVGLLYAFLVWYTPILLAATSGEPGSGHGKLSPTFYAVILFSSILHSVTSTFHFCSKMSFFARVSDPAIGGTYMTMLNTVSNLGNKWPNSLSLYVIEWLTKKECRSVAFEGDVLTMSTCASPEEINICKSHEGKCVTTVDGYFVEIAICTVLGMLWLLFMRSTVRRVQELPSEAWQISAGNKSNGKKAEDME